MERIFQGQESEPRHLDRQQVDPLFLRLFDQRREQRPILDHVTERLARLDLAVEGQESRPHRVLQAAVGNHHVEDRLRGVRDLVPDPDHLEQSPRCGDNRRGARVGRHLAERRIGDRDRERWPEPLA